MSNFAAKLPYYPWTIIYKSWRIQMDRKIAWSMVNGSVARWYDHPDGGCCCVTTNVALVYHKELVEWLNAGYVNWL